MIVKKDKLWQRLPRIVHRLESVSVARDDRSFYHSVLVIPYPEFLKLDPEVSGFPLKCTLDGLSQLGLWPKPVDYFDVHITASEIFSL